MIILNEKQKKQFWAKIDIKSPNECWEWTAGMTGRGRCGFGLNKRSIAAHRLAFMTTHDMKDESNCVCHTCGNKLCCNPNHLIERTASRSRTQIDKETKSVKEKKIIIKTDNLTQPAFIKIDPWGDIIKVTAEYRLTTDSARKHEYFQCFTMLTYDPMLDSGVLQHHLNSDKFKKDVGLLCANFHITLCAEPHPKYGNSNWKGCWNKNSQNIKAKMKNDLYALALAQEE